MQQGRVGRLAEALAEAGVDAFLGHHPITLGYLHGFRENPGERFLALAVRANGDVRLIAPALSESQARRAGIEDVRVWRDGEDPILHLNQLADDWALKTAIVAVDPTLPARQLLTMQNALPATLFRDGEAILGELMRTKQPDELDSMRAAARIADAAYNAVVPHLVAGMTERQVERLIVGAMADLGGDPTFCIIATGPNSAEPHHLTDDTVLEPGHLLLLDFGCAVNGYQSDITRCVGIGFATEAMFKMYDLVREAHLAGLSAVRPGVPANQVDAATRGVIQAAGHAEAFFHRTGHGIGLNGHEAPYISQANDEPLRPGECFSIEPGVYFTGEFGIRLETIVTVTEDGYENLNEALAETLVVVG